MGDCFTAASAVDFATKDTNRVQGTIAMALAENSPFIDVLDGGTFASGVSDSVRSVVQLPAAPGDSLVNPTFVNDTDIGGTFGTQDQVSTYEYSYRLQSKRGRGPRVNVKTGYAAFKESYVRAEESLKALIVQYINADVKYQLMSQSASKFIAVNGYKFDDLFTGGDQSNVGIGFANGGITPTGPLSFKGLHRVARHLREVLLAEPFGGSGAGAHFKFIGGPGIIEQFRTETDVKEVLIAQTTGGYDKGEQALTGYSWDASGPYRGIQLGIDQSPMRANVISAAGVPVWLNPWKVIDDGNGKAHRARPDDWLSAKYEGGLLIAKNTFQRLVPERYNLGGSFKFAPQLWAGDLDWHYQFDNDCNQFGDFGWHKFQITRAYRPIRPQHVVGLLWKRCEADMGLYDCTTASGTTYSGSNL